MSLDSLTETRLTTAHPICSTDKRSSSGNRPHFFERLDKRALSRSSEFTISARCLGLLCGFFSWGVFSEDGDGCQNPRASVGNDSRSFRLLRLANLFYYVKKCSIFGQTSIDHPSNPQLLSCSRIRGLGQPLFCGSGLGLFKSNTPQLQATFGFPLLFLRSENSTHPRRLASLRLNSSNLFGSSNSEVLDLDFAS